MRRITALLIGVATLACFAGCQREDRQFQSPPSGSTAVNSIQMPPLHAGNAPPLPPVANAYQENAYAMAQGQRLFTAYNCNGCHANGGGGSGPALMDDVWIYGSAPQNIFATIVEGRPNGMPSFRGRIPDDQVWQITAYVRSLSGLAPFDAAPSRRDAMEAKLPEGRTPPQPPTGGAQPSPSAK